MSDIKKEMIFGVAYTAVAKYSGILISLLVTAILARLLAPEEFGIVAIATVIIAFFSIFCDLGIAPAIIQKKDLDNDDLSYIFSFTIWTGFFLSVLFFLSSYYIADYYDKEILVPICKILSINLLFASVNIVPNALLYKNKEFKFIAIRTLAVQIIAGVIAITAALCGLGIYSLLINPVISSITLFIISYIRYPQKIRFSLGIASIRKIFSFSMYQFFFNVINYFSRNLDKLLVGKYLGMNPLGYYEKSYRLMMLPLQNITNVVSPVMHPIFSAFQNDYKKLSDSYMKVFKLLAFIGFPLAIFLFFTSKELVLIVFGRQWVNSIMTFQILSLSVGIQIVLSTSGSIFQAANSTKIMFMSGLLSTILTICGIIFGIFISGTIEGVAMGVLISFIINFVQCYYLLYRVTFKFSMKPVFKQLVSPSILALISAIPLAILSYLTPEVNIILSLILKGLSFCIIWCVYIQLSHEYDIISKLKSMLNRKSK